MRHQRMVRALILASAFGVACSAPRAPRKPAPPLERRLEGAREQAGHRFLSLTLFLGAPPKLDEAALLRAGERAWRGWPNREAKEFAVGTAPVFLVSRDGVVILVTVLHRNYFGATAPDGAPAHEAFVAVDFLRSERERTDAEIYRILGAFTESLMSEESVALFVPPSSLVFTLDSPDHVFLIRRALRSDHVLSALDRWLEAPPVGAGASAP